MTLVAGCGFSGAAATGDSSADDAQADDAQADDSSTDDTSTDDAMTVDAAAVVGDWWDPAYAYRAPIIVTAGGALVEGYSIVLVADTKALVDADRVEMSGRDWRIVRRRTTGSGVEWTELDRWVEDVPMRQFDRAATRTWFRLPAPLAAQGVDSETYVYYGAGSNAGNPPRDLNQVFLFGDDFETDLAQWARNNKGEDPKIVGERAAGAKALELNAGAVPAAGLHRDLELPRTPVVFSRWVRQAQTTASFAEARGFDKVYAERPQTWVEADLRLATELDSGDQMQVWATNNVLTNWLRPFGVNQWREVDTVYDSMANLVQCRVDGMPFTAAIASRYTQDSPIRSIALEGEGQGGRFWLDNFIIRHHVSPEPSAVLGPEEARPER